jgi:DNA-binding NarL/FixJ family response regulator
VVVISVLSAFESLEVRRRVALMIDECEDVEVIGEAVNAVEAVQQGTAARPDVVLIDAEMPHVTGIEAARLLLGQGYSGAIIVVSDDVSQLEDALRSGAAGYLLKNCPADEMLGAIRQVLEGDFVFGGSVLKIPEGMAIAARYMTDRKRPDGATADAPGQRVRDRHTEPSSGEDTTAAEQETSQRAPQHPERDVPDTESASPPQAPGPSAFAGDVEFVVSPPVDTTFVLRLYQWLLGQAFADVNEVAGSWTGDTVVKATFRQPVALSDMFAEVPDVVEVIEEPLPEDSDAVLKSLRPLGLGIKRTVPRRFRIVLKHD